MIVAIVFLSILLYMFVASTTAMITYKLAIRHFQMDRADAVGLSVTAALFSPIAFPLVAALATCITLDK